MFQTTFKEYAQIPANAPVLLLVIVDTEEEFDWGRPLSRDNTSVESIAEQHRAQEIFARHGVVPTYVVDYPVATSERAVQVLGGFQTDGLCEIGAHLHPWVTPPHEEPVNAFNSYPGNLPADLEREKLEVLSAAIENNIGFRPRVYKAGRYGLGINTAAILKETGYDVDLSVVPYTSFAADGGPDYRTFGASPYWFGAKRKLLEIPLTCGFAGVLATSGPRLFPALSSDLGMKLRLPGIAARLRLLERIRLTPEGIDHAAHRRLINSMLAEGHRVFAMTYHSPSLQPGNTPYVRDKADLKAFLGTLRRTLDYFLNEIGGKATTPGALFRLLRPGAEKDKS